MASLPSICKADLTFGKELGSGSYGAVYKADWRPSNGAHITVAVKRVLLLEKEAQNLNEIRHKNIIRFYGVCNSKPDFYIITEFAPGGSLKKYLGDPGNPALEFNHILNWAKDIIEGVKYLHLEAPTPLLHRDLKSDNVVISDDNVCKLCDFGTAKPAGLPNTSVAGTAAWMSPEMIQNEEAKVGAPTDIFSYAVIVWEMVTRQVPFKGMNDFMIYMLVVEKGERLTIPSSCPQQLGRLIADCWGQDPGLRPAAPAVLARLQEMSGDRALSAAAERFLADRDRWLKEIAGQATALLAREAELLSRQMDLDRQARHRLAGVRSPSAVREEDIINWDVKDVAQWLRSIDVSDHELEKLSQLVTAHAVNGERLLMLTSEDLDRLSVPLGTQKVVLRRRDEANQRHLQLINFPPLLDTRPDISAKKRPRFRQMTITLLSGLYFRRVITRNSSGPYERWKPFVDVDVDDLGDLELSGREPSSLIRDVTFCFPQPHPREPFRVASTGGRLPFAPPEWLIGLRQEEISVVVNYLDTAVLKPRNTRFSITASSATAGHCAVKQVDLTIKISGLSPLTLPATPSRRNGLEPSPSSDNVWESRSSSNLLFAASAALAPPPTASLSPRSPMWSTIAERGSTSRPSSFKTIADGLTALNINNNSTSPLPQRKPSILTTSEPTTASVQSPEARAAFYKRTQSDSQDASPARRNVQFGVGDSIFSGTHGRERSVSGSSDTVEAAAASVEEQLLGNLQQRKNSADKSPSGSLRPRVFSLTPSFHGARAKTRSPRASTDETPPPNQRHHGTRKRGRPFRTRVTRSRSDGTLLLPDLADFAPLPFLDALPSDLSPVVEGIVAASAAAKPKAPYPSASAARKESSNLSLQIYGGNQKWMWTDEEDRDKGSS